MKSMSSTVERTNEEKILKILVEQASMGSCIMQDGKFCYINSSFSSDTGYTANELVGKDSFNIVVPEDREMVRENTIKMLKGELHSPYQFRVICKDGSIRWVMATVKSVQYHGRRAILGNYMEITWHKQIEDALKEREERYREIANSITDIFFAMDEHLKYTYWNKASEVLTGIRAEDAIGKSIGEIFPDTHWRRKAEKVYRKVLRTQQPQTFVNDYDIDGRHYIFEISAYPSRCGISVFVSDITESKQADDRLKESEQKYRLLFETSLDCIAQIDREGRYITANPATARSLGVSLEELNGKAVSEVVPRKVAQFRLRMMRKALDERQPQTFEDEREGRYFHHIVIPIKTSDQKEAVQVITRDITERKKMEEAINLQRAYFQQLFDNSPDAILMTDTNSKVIQANRGSEVLFGYSNEEVKGQSLTELIVPEVDVQEASDSFQRILGGEVIRKESVRRRKDGSLVDVSIIAYPIHSNDKLIGLYGVYSDISERKQAEEALRQSEEKYRTILEEMEDAYFEVDLGGHFTFVNNSVCRDLGYSREELIGMSYKGFTVEEDIESVFQVFNEVYQTGVPNKGFPWKTIRKDGVQGFAETSVSPLRNEKGEIIGFRGVGRDITERKQTEEKLRQSRANYRALFDSSVIGALVVDAETMKVVMANESAMKMFGFSSPEDGVNPLDFVPPEDKEKNLELIVKEVFEKDSRGSIDLPVMTKDGRNIWVSVTGARITHKGKLAGLFSFTDITERKLAEEKLRQSEENYKTLFNSSVTGMYVLDIETMKVVMGNRAAAEMAGFSSAGEGIGVNPFDFVIPEAREQVLEMAAKEFEQGLQQTHELPVIAKDGGTGWISISSAKIMHEGRLAALVSFTNITDRKRAEEALRQSEENYRALFDSSVIGTFVLDAETMKVVVVNRAATEMLGFSSVEEAVGINPLDFIPSEDRDMVLEIVTKELFEQDLRRTHELRATTKDGRKIWVSVTAARIMRGDRLAALVSFTDITERKKMEEKLELLSSVTQQVSDAIIITDADFNITYVNKATQDLFGYSLEEMLKKHMGAFNVEPLPESLEQEIEQTVSSGKLWVGTLVKKRKDGSTFLSECHITPLYDEEGKISSYTDVLRDITERKQAEEALQAERNKLQSIIDAMQDSLTIQDRDYNIIFQNELARISSGGDHVGEKCYRVYEGNVTICKDCPVEKSFKDSKPHVSERQQVLPSGELTFWETTSNPIRDAKGRVVACLEIGRNITERKKQEQKLADELTRRRLLIDQSLDGIVVLDVDAKVVEANQRFAEMLGYTLEEVHGLHTWDWDKQYPRKKILEMGRGVDEKGFHLETKHTRKDGSVIDVDISIHGAMCAGQKLIFCVCRDITERNKMDKALKQAAEEWKRTFDSISDAISIHDREFRILQANKAFADIFHKKHSQIIGGFCYELHNGQKPHSGCPHKQTLSTKEPAAAEFYESNLGKYLHESTSPIFDEKGEVVATVHITRDVTEQKQQNERLMMTDRLASIGELASGAAHELNNPLTSIIGFSQLLMEKEVPDDIRDDLKLINNEAQRAAVVTNNLLAFARKHTPTKQLNQINNIIEDVLELRAHEHKVNHIDVDRHLAPNLPEILVDYFQMQQVFMNIIINAEYFITKAHNGGTLTIVTQKDNSTVSISIIDDGPGIPPENLGRVFDPFFTTKEAGKGTGLGLSICHGIVTEHGGQIYARSQLGKGATIFVELPIKNRAQIKSTL
jgi:PAS domain S-box-containing protein